MKPLHLLAGLALLLATGGCRHSETRNAPIHPISNMDQQKRFDPQEANPFFADLRADRPPVAGTVARGYLGRDAAFTLGRSAPGGAYVTTIPMRVTRELVERGQERYNIYCSMCHGLAGDGQGIIMTGGYGYTPAPTYHDDRLRAAEDGYLYEVIANGIRTMPPYGHQVPVADRWAIVAYIRALQRTQDARLDDVPEDMRRSLTQAAAGAAANTAAANAADTTAAGAP